MSLMDRLKKDCEEQAAVLEAAAAALIDNDDPELAALILKGWRFYASSFPGVTLETVLSGEAGEIVW